MKGVYIFLANGFEDIEALATRDILVRGGADVKTISINDSKEVDSAHGITVLADMTLTELLKLEDCKTCTAQDMLIFPGGLPGSKNLGECRELIGLMNRHYSLGGAVAAICAAPNFVLSQLEGIEKATFTCYDGCQDLLVSMGANFMKKPAVTWNRIITGRGPGHSIDFGLAILETVCGSKTAADVAAGLTLPCI